MVELINLLEKFLLLTSLDTHFLPYHNGGHHFNVATPDDAATARKNELLYTFWIRSHFSSYLQAWKLENKRMNENRRSWFHFQNRMLVYTICNLLFLSLIFFFFGKNSAHLLYNFGYNWNHFTGNRKLYRALWFVEKKRTNRNVMSV